MPGKPHEYWHHGHLPWDITGAAIRVRKDDGGKDVVLADTPDGRLKAEGATAKEAKALLTELL